MPGRLPLPKCRRIDSESNREFGNRKTPGRSKVPQLGREPVGRWPPVVAEKMDDTIAESDFEQAITWTTVQRIPYCPKCGAGVDDEQVTDDERAVIQKYVRTV
jgi:hypothetical protein